ncbi:uncharacterized protein HMPREF1541_07273 [Cyphellophora europaea CBS 101466]|uniref:Uncharacterized protein n=1 Tax=Cyphellophora europaea (strain CBS 101466) TaxID=1220924 RepID=W2RMU6_CYPE1|nr:uncharacterized protein HMPREF1541_07273 [Cyphellophora europaea CBS 101466]ETN37650.1 hypothetical protein HMPREF1541_07273 [Cyphellophora europaea CBS 101466]
MSNNNLGSYPADAAAHPDHMNCVYAISGTYGLLPRALYYVTLAFAIFGRHRQWLVIGALVTAMTYAGTTAIHQMALVSSKEYIYDLDILGAWAILSSGALAYIGMMHWSSTLRDSHVRVIFLLWGLLLGIALIFGRSEIFSTPLTPPEPACYSSTGQLLEYPIELGSPLFNCTYQCFSKRKPMRQASEVMAIPYSTLKNKYTDLSVVLVGPIQFAAYAALSWDSMQHSPSRTCTWIVMKYLQPKHHERLVRFIHDASMEHRYGGYVLLIHFMWRIPWSWLKFCLVSFTLPWFILGVIVDVLALPLLVINITLNEITLLKPDLPTNEANYAIGQWGPWTASVMVVFATFLNQFLLWNMRRKQRAKAAADEKKRQKQSENVYEIQERLEEQTTGVVKPGLMHIPTLQDMGRPT